MILPGTIITLSLFSYSYSTNANLNASINNEPKIGCSLNNNSLSSSLQQPTYKSIELQTSSILSLTCPFLHIKTPFMSAQYHMRTVTTYILAHAATFSKLEWATTIPISNPKQNPITHRNPPLSMKYIFVILLTLSTEVKSPTLEYTTALGASLISS